MSDQMGAVPFDAIDIIRLHDLSALKLNLKFHFRWSFLNVDIKKLFDHFTGKSFSSIILTIASSTSLSLFSAADLSISSRPFLMDSDLPNLINKLIRNFDINFCFLFLT